MMTAESFRNLALDLQDAVEGAHMGHPDFRANGRIFATIQKDNTRGTVKLTSDEQAVVIGEHPGVFAPASGAWGRQGWTTIQFAAADPASVRTALLLAWEAVVAKPRIKRAAPPAPRAPTKAGVQRASRAKTKPKPGRPA